MMRMSSNKFKKNCLRFEFLPRQFQREQIRMQKCDKHMRKNYRFDENFTEIVSYRLERMATISETSSILSFWGNVHIRISTASFIIFIIRYHFNITSLSSSSSISVSQHSACRNGDNVSQTNCRQIPDHEVRGRQRPRLRHLGRAGELQSSFSFQYFKDCQIFF